MKERLIELLDETMSEQYEKRYLVTAEHTAGHLLANGVIVPPCKVGDMVWFLNDRYHIELSKDEIYKAVVSRILILRDYEGNPEVYLAIQIRGEFGCVEFQSIKDIGKTVFLTKEEAEKALAERSEGK